MRRLICLLPVAAAAGYGQTAFADCPTLVQGVGVAVARFSDGVIGVRGHLNVNPDGTDASYSPGDHGYTYIVNGIDLWVDGSTRSCQVPANDCRARFLDSESKGFVPGTLEFCAFAIDVEPIPPANAVVKCTKGLVFGNGKGRPRVGGTMSTAVGGSAPYYVSTTALTVRVDGKVTAIDSAKVPSVVVPVSGGDSLLGAVAWVSYRDRWTLAVVADTGPDFGEGSIALHQMLRYGELRPQAPGPIPVNKRCTQAESALLPPFESRPDAGKSDRCEAGRKAASAADIRAYVGIPDSVRMLVLPKARLPHTGTTLDGPPTAETMAAALAQGGYSDTAIANMSSCLK